MKKYLEAMVCQQYLAILLDSRLSRATLILLQKLAKLNMAYAELFEVSQAHG